MKKRIVERATEAVFGRPLVSNSYRGILVEAIVSEALGARWRWVSGDWAAWDFQRADGKRLEVKQSAAIQSWHGPDSPIASPRFDCAARTGRWEGSQWYPGSGRFADIYVFAYHDETNVERADHRNPDQWTFYVVREDQIPAQKTIGITKIRELGTEATYANLYNAVESLAK